MHSSEKPMAEILYAYMDKLLTVARFLENATAVVVSSAQALPVMISLASRPLMNQDQLSAV